MKFRLAAYAAAALVGAFATSALAAGPVTAKLQTPVEAARKPVAGGAVFRCLGDTCVAATPIEATVSVRACRELKRDVGPVSAYGSQSKQLDAEQLAACNK
jgi:hypothetical protein